MGVIWHSRNSKMIVDDSRIDPCPGRTIDDLRRRLRLARWTIAIFVAAAVLHWLQWWVL